MAGAAGHSVAALSLYLGLKESEVRERVAALKLPAAAEKPLRRPVSANPWSVEEVRRLIALWLDNVSVTSIAGALGRTPSSIRGKRRWLGLGVRVRTDLADRPVAQCRATALPWKPTLNIKPILCRLWAPKIGKGAAVAARPEAVPEVRWELGRDAQKDDRFSTLGFAGLSAAAIAKRMLMEFGVYMTEGAVNSRMTRLQIARDRFDIIDVFDEAAVQRRAAEAKRRVGATLRFNAPSSTDRSGGVVRFPATAPPAESSRQASATRAVGPNAHAAISPRWRLKRAEFGRLTRRSHGAVEPCCAAIRLATGREFAKRPWGATAQRLSGSRGAGRVLLARVRAVSCSSCG